MNPAKFRDKQLENRPERSTKQHPEKREISTNFVPEADRFLPFNDMEVSCPLTIAKGDINVNSGVLHVPHGLHMRILPGISV